MKETCSRNEVQLVLVGFILSMFHWALCFAYFACLLVFLNQGTIGCIKGLLIITMRGILSTGVSANINSLVSYEKFALIFIFAIYIFVDSGKYCVPMAVSQLKGFVAVFAIYNIATAFLTSSYPIVAVFKSISYAVPFCAVLMGVSCTNKQMDWIDYLNDLMTPIIMLSIVLLRFPGRSRIVNSDFQGAINHPNLFGIFGSLYIGITLYSMSKHPERGSFLRTILVVVTFYMVYLSASRTGMFSAAIMLCIFLVSQKGAVRRKLLGLLAVGAFVVLAFSVINPSFFGNLSKTIYDFVYKRDTTDLWASREGLTNTSKIKYEAHPLTGSGFCVPYYPYIRDMKFSLSLTYEAGNIWWAVLGDCGIIGAVIFWGYMLYIFLNTRMNRWVLFFYPIVLSMGEMAFFATNNIAIIYYVFYALCLAEDNGYLEKGYEV